MKRSLGAKTLIYPVPVWVIASYDQAGKPNAMTASWAGVCCSKPPCVAVSLRKATYTYGCLMHRRAFTVNVPSQEQVAIADYLGVASGRREDKLAAAGLTAVRSSLVDAPYLEEFALILECRVIHVLEIGLHTLFVGEILDVKADPAVLDERGMPIVEKIRPFVYAPELQRYHRVAEVIAKAFDVDHGTR